MRIVLLILLASTAALALTALLVRPDASRAALEARRSPLLAAAALRPAPIATLPAILPGAMPTRARSPQASIARAASPSGDIPSAMPLPANFALPLTERALSVSRRADPIEPELRDAMERIEPVMDPTRLDGPFAPPVFRIWPGTASLVDAFGEHWRLASDDPNVQQRVRSYALAWHRAVPLGCDDYAKNRAHQAGAPALSALTVDDCERLHRRALARRDDAPPVPIVAAPLSLAVFAAPLPGARMSSQDFWAAQRMRIDAVRDRLQRRWQAAHGETGGIGLRD